MSLNVGDAQSFSKKIGDKGNMNICPRTKTYNESIGNVLAAAAVGILAFMVFFSKISDFVFTDLKSGQSRRDDMHNNNQRIQHRNDHSRNNQFRR